MPKDNSQTQNPQNNTAPVADDMPPIMMEDTHPPMINEGEQATVISNEPSPVTTPPVTDSGSAAPADDIVMPSVVTSGPNVKSPTKKFGGGKVIATILGLFLLVGGVGAGVMLTQQNQDIREQAAITGTCSCMNVNGVNAGYGTCNSDGSCDCRPNLVKNNACVRDGGGDADSRTPAEWRERCSELAILYPNCNSSTWVGCHAEQQSDCQDWFREPEPTPTTPPATTPPAISAVCQDVKAYSETWTLLTNAQLSQLKAGNKVNFCVTGSASSGSFNKARFTINNVLQAETTTVRPSGTDFCQTYTIPAATTTFAVSAQINHVTLGWK